MAVHGGSPSDAAADLEWLCAHVLPRVSRALREVDTPYGPRLFAGFSRLKRCARELRQIRNEVELIESTSLVLAARRRDDRLVRVIHP